MLELSLVFAAIGCAEARDTPDGVSSSPSERGVEPRNETDAPARSGAAGGPFVSRPEVMPEPQPAGRNGLPPGTCPSIACSNGARLYFDVTESFESLLALRFEICRNDVCYTGGLHPDSERPPPSSGSGIGFGLPARDIVAGEDHASVFVHSDGGGGLYLQVEWVPWSADSLKDGDRYVIRIVEPAGQRRVLLSTLASYEDNSIREPCYQHCELFTLDSRGRGAPESGDAGASD